jgi:Tol biopolymer transport system component
MKSARSLNLLLTLTLLLSSTPVARTTEPLKMPGSATTSAAALNFLIASLADSATQDTTALVSVASDGTQGNDISFMPSISADGRYVAFVSFADNLVSGDTNDFCANEFGGGFFPGAHFTSCADVFVHDRHTGETTRVSVASDGSQANGQVHWFSTPSISADGRYVAFASDASNLVRGDTNKSGDIFVHDRQTGQTTRVSVASDGTQGNGYSFHPSISANGRYVAFGSWASNLIDGDTNDYCYTSNPYEPRKLINCADIFVHDRQTGQTTRVSVASNGTQGNSDVHWGAPSISADGRYVAFGSSASNLVIGDNDGNGGAFIHDRQTGETNHISEYAGCPSLSSDGRYVAFSSGRHGIFIHDRHTGETTNVAMVTDNTLIYHSSFSCPSISSDGRFVAFASDASSLVSDDTNNFCHYATRREDGNCSDIFVYDRQIGQTNRISVAADGAQANDHSSYERGSPSISADGRYVAFASWASNLVNEDSNDYCWKVYPGTEGGIYNCEDVFVHDRGEGETVLPPELITAKRETIYNLSNPGVEILGVRIPAKGYDESGAKPLIEQLEKFEKEGTLTSEQVEAFARLKIQEDGLAGIYPLYAEVQSEFVDFTVDLVAIPLFLEWKSDGIVKWACDRGNPFCGVCRRLQRKIAKTVLSLLNDVARLASRFLPEDQAEDFRRFWDLLIESVSLEHWPGRTTLDILLDTVVKGFLLEWLMAEYVDDTQPRLDQGIRSADSTYTGTEPTWSMEGKRERAELQIETLVAGAKSEAENAREWYEALRRGVDVAKLEEDLAKLAMLTGWPAVGLWVQIGTYFIQGVTDWFGVYYTRQAGACIYYLAEQTGELAFNPQQPIRSCRSGEADTQTTMRVAYSHGTYGDATAWARAWLELSQDQDVYQQALAKVLETLSQGDEHAIIKAVDAFLEADDALSASLRVTQEIAVAMTVLGELSPDQTRMLTEANAFTGESLALYFALVGRLATFDDPASNNALVEEQAERMLIGLDSFVAALETVAPTQGPASALPLIINVDWPEFIPVGELFDVSVNLRNVGSKSAAELSVQVEPGEIFDGGTVTLAEPLSQDKDITVNVRLEASREGSELLSVDLLVKDQLVDRQLVLLAVHEPPPPTTEPELPSPEPSTPEPTPEEATDSAPVVVMALAVTCVLSLVLIGMVLVFVVRSQRKRSSG